MKNMINFKWWRIRWALSAIYFLIFKIFLKKHSTVNERLVRIKHLINVVCEIYGLSSFLVLAQRIVNKENLPHNTEWIAECLNGTHIEDTRFKSHLKKEFRNIIDKAILEIDKLQQNEKD